MVVPIDRVGGSMLTPRWSTPEELELDEVRAGAGPWQWFAVAPGAPLNWSHSLVALVGIQAPLGKRDSEMAPRSSENWLMEDSLEEFAKDPWSGRRQKHLCGSREP